MVAFVTRLVLVHGSVTNARLSWGKQAPLGKHFELVTPNRPGFPGGPPAPRVDFARDAEWLPTILAPGDVLVTHSYAGLGALLAAGDLPVSKLMLLEPPAFRLAWDDPAVQEWVAGAAALPRDSAESYLRAFLPHVGAPLPPPDLLTEDWRSGAELFFDERLPTEAEIELARLPYPVLVVTGAHSAAFDAVADAIVAGLGAERIVLAGAGHAIQLAPGFNELF
jgi:hypothetical protein